MARELTDVLIPSISSDGIFISYENLLKAECWCDRHEKTFVLNLSEILKEIEKKREEKL